MAGNIVEEFYEGDTRIKICDDFCRTVGEQDAGSLLKQATDEIWPMLTAPSDQPARW